MEYLIKNAVIATMDKEKPFAASAAVREGKFVFCGGEKEAEGFVSNGAEVLDCGGAFIMPGFNDSHMHYLHYVKSKLSVDLSGADSVEDIVRRMKAALDSYDPKSGLWLVGEGWNQDYFTKGERRFPTAADLDKITLEHPVLIMRTCYHVGVLNTKAMMLIGLDAAEAAKQGDFAEKDSFGSPTGVVKENFFDDIKSRLPCPNLETLIEMMLKAQKDLFAKGITAVQSDDMKYAPDGEAYEMLEKLKAASVDGRLKLRYAEQALSQTKDELDEFFSHDFDSFRGGSFKVSCVKLISDGSLGARTALLKKPYADEPTTKGIAIYTQEELDCFIEECQRRNIPAAVHAIGDGALEMCQRAFASAKAKYPEFSPRHGIVHCQITSKGQVLKFRELGLLAYTQPIFIDYDMHIVRDRVGDELAETSYAWKDYLDLGVNESFGTDCPVESFDPLRGVYCAVTRRDTKGHGPYLPDEAISAYDALYAYTAAGVYASGDEERYGKIKPGMLADFVLLDRDLTKCPPEEILRAKVLKTFVGGECVYSAK